MMKDERFERDFEDAKAKYPKLNLTKSSDGSLYYVINGEIDIIDHEGYLWGTFQISILFHRTYPKGFPILFDKSKSFPWNIDWHISSSGECCVCNKIESIEKSIKGITVLEFVDDYVVPFYSNQIYKRKYGRYVNGEYSHNDEGIWEALEEEFKTKNRKTIMGILEQVGKKRGRNDLCYCQSGLKFKNCHFHRDQVLKELKNGWKKYVSIN